MLPRSRAVGSAGIAWYAVLGALYDEGSWPTWPAPSSSPSAATGRCCSSSPTRTGAASPNGSYSNLQDAYTANTCLDFPAPTDVATYTDWATTLTASAPHFAKLLAYNDLPCAFWPVASRADPKARRPAGAPPIVVVGSTLDPATPYAWAVALSKELASGVLVTRDGEGHTGYRSSACVQTAVDGYLLDLNGPQGRADLPELISAR